MGKIITAVFAVCGIGVFISSFYFGFQFIRKSVGVIASKTRPLSFEDHGATDVSRYLLGPLRSILKTPDEPLAVSANGWGYGLETKSLRFTINDKIEQIVSSERCGESGPILIKDENQRIYTFDHQLKYITTTSADVVGISKRAAVFYDSETKLLSAVPLKTGELFEPRVMEAAPAFVCIFNEFAAAVLVDGTIIKLLEENTVAYISADREVTSLIYDDGLLSVGSSGLVKSFSPDWETNLGGANELTSFTFLPDTLTFVSEKNQMHVLDRQTGELVGSYALPKRDLVGKHFIATPEGFVFFSRSGSFQKLVVRFGSSRELVLFKQQIFELLDSGWGFLLRFLPLTVLFSFLLLCFRSNIVQPLPISLLVVLVSSVESEIFVRVVVASFPVLAGLSLARDIASVNRFLCGLLVGIFFWFYLPIRNPSDFAYSIVFGGFAAWEMIQAVSAQLKLNDSLGLQSFHNIIVKNFAMLMLLSLSSSIFVILSAGMILSVLELERLYVLTDFNSFSFLLFLLILIALRLPWIVSKRLSAAAV